MPHVAASIRRFGWRQPIVARPSGEVIAGNTRLKAAHRLGANEVPVVWFEGSDLEATAYAIADNRTHELAEWDEPALAGLLARLRAEDGGLEGVGFDAGELDELLARVGADEDLSGLEDAGAEEPPAKPVSRPGDLWLLGDHRLLCGDSTRIEDLARVMGDEQADAVLTDPPYGVSYVGGTGLRIQNDDAEGLRRLLRAALGNAYALCRPGAVWYVAAPAGTQFLDFAAVFSVLGVWRQTLVWVKDALVLGHSDFHYRHEPLLYGWKAGDHRAPPNRLQDSVWEIPRPKASRDHPTMKPVELYARAMVLSTLTGDRVLEPFGGSGTTLVAAEGTGRRCRAVEIDPAYADVIVRRWERAAGREALLEGTGQSLEEVAAARA